MPKKKNKIKDEDELNVNLIEIDISKIKPNPSNPRIIKDDRFEKLVKSIKDFPKMMELRPIIVDSNNMILGGNMRLKALNYLSYKKIPKSWIKQASDLTDKEKEQFIIKDNVGFGDWDWDMLANEWNNEQLDEWGLDVPDFALNKEAVEDDFEIPEEVKTDIVLGDLFEIGEHRLLCGDSTDSDAVGRLMNGQKADMVFTDPPYRMEGVEGGSNQLVGKAARKLGERIKHLCDFDPVAFLNNLPTVFNNGKMNAYIFCNKDLVPDYLNWALSNGYSFNILFWKKPTAIPLGGSHRPDVEYLLLFRKSAIWNNAVEGVSYSKCLEFARELSKDHPTLKPIALIENELKISSNLGSLVCDFFLGSGSTMVASHQLNRKCYGMEIDPKYCQVIIDRMLRLDPSIIVKKNGKPFIINNQKPN